MINIYTIFGGLAVAAVSIIGLLIIKSHKKLANYIEENLNFFTALSGGVFLVTSYVLIKESLEILEFEKALISISIGILAYALLYRVFPAHRHKGDEHEHKHSKRSAIKILIGDSIHNIADGLLLVASFGSSFALGYTNTLSIMLHEAPQEISEFFVLRKSGYTNREALVRNIITALSIFIGIFIGAFLINTTIIEGYLLGAVGAFFLGIVFFDLFPVRTIIKAKETKKLGSALIIGIITMSGISFALGGGHSHEHGDHAHHDHGHDHHEEHHDEDEHIHEHDNELILEEEIVMDEKDHEHEHHDHDDHNH